MFEDQDKFKFYHGDLKREIDSLLANQPVDFRLNPANIENVYNTVIGKHMPEIIEGKIKTRFASGTGGSTDQAALVIQARVVIKSLSLLTSFESSTTLRLRSEGICKDARRRRSSVCLTHQKQPSPQQKLHGQMLDSGEASTSTFSYSWSYAEFEKQIDAVLAKRAADRKEAAQPKEPDWSTLSEKEAMSTAIYIPMIEHDVPDYMNMMLKDTEYECVWASKDQRRLGQLVAEGYEFLKLEHVHPQFKVPLASIRG